MSGMAVIRPLADLGKQAERLGFKMQVSHDAQARVVAIRLRSVTPRARQACKVASGSSQLDAIEASVRYDEAYDPAGLIELFRLTAETALERARETL